MNSPTHAVPAIFRMALASLWIGWALPVQSQGLEWNVSVKVVLDAQGRRPCDGNPADPNCRRHTDDLIRTMFESVSAGILASRGYSVRVTEIIDLPGVSQWFDSEISRDTNVGIRQAATNDVQTYRYRQNAINVYILNRRGSDGGGVCSFNSRNEPGRDDIIILGQTGSPTVPMHELGHYFGLCHTAGCGFDEPNDGEPYVAGDEDPSQGITDTLLDNRCWDSQASIALMNFGACKLGNDCAILTKEECLARGGGWYREGTTNCPPPAAQGLCMTCQDGNPPQFNPSLAGSCTGYFLGPGSTPLFYLTVLNAEQRSRVDAVFNNLMSYHWNSPHEFLTEDQLDRMTDISNRIRARIHIGRTFFVSGNAQAGGDGHRLAPFRSVSDGYLASRLTPEPDIVLIRGGTYTETVLFDQPVELRATRGTVVIGP